MSVLIRGMEMPKEGNETILRLMPDGTVLDQYGHHLALKAFPVAPHGDLIDRSKIEYTYAMQGGVLMTSNKIIDRLPSIIPAEPEEGEMK